MSSSCSTANRNAAATFGAVTGQNGKLTISPTWLKNTCNAEITSEELARLDREEASRKVSQVVEDHFRPEMRRMERALLLQILDTAWKDHLLAMDHLKSSVGLRGYAQVDPKVEYKREGMALFESMWSSIGNYVTDLIFRMEQLDESFVGSTWIEGAATRKTPGRSAKSNSNSKPRSPARKRTRRSNRSATWAPKSAATTPAPAAAARSTSSAACGRVSVMHEKADNRLDLRHCLGCRNDNVCGLRVRSLETTVNALNQRLQSNPTVVTVGKTQTNKDSAQQPVFKLIESAKHNEHTTNIGVPWNVERAMMSGTHENDSNARHNAGRNHPIWNVANNTNE